MREASIADGAKVWPKESSKGDSEKRAQIMHSKDVQVDQSQISWPLLPSPHGAQLNQLGRASGQLLAEGALAGQLARTTEKCPAGSRQGKARTPVEAVAGLPTAECKMIYGSLQMACSRQRAPDQKNRELPDAGC